MEAREGPSHGRKGCSGTHGPVAGSRRTGAADTRSAGPVTASTRSARPPRPSCASPAAPPCSGCEVDTPGSPDPATSPPDLDARGTCTGPSIEQAGRVGPGLRCRSSVSSSGRVVGVLSHSGTMAACQGQAGGTWETPGWVMCAGEHWKPRAACQPGDRPAWSASSGPASEPRSRPTRRGPSSPPARSRPYPARPASTPEPQHHQSPATDQSAS